MWHSPYKSDWNPLMTRDSVVRLANPTEPEDDLLDRIQHVLPILADLARADAFLCVREEDGIRVLAHSRPHSIAPVHRALLTGDHISRATSPTIFDVFERNRYLRG